MLGIADWARDLLVSRGALVEADGGETLRAMLPEDVAAALGAGDWLSLQFDSGAGSDDAGEWLERLSALLPAGESVAGARVRTAEPVFAIDCEAVLARELVIQNGICRLVEDYGATATYGLFTFQYTVESDERSLGMVTIGLNATAQSAISHPESLLHAVRDRLVAEDAPVAVAPEELRRLYAMAERGARREVRKRAAGFEESANRRLARDAARVESYYAGLLAQIQKRLDRRAADEEAAARERSRAAATEADRAAKLEDLVRKYSLRIRIELAGCLLLRLPVREIAVRLIRKKEERRRVVHWNPALRLLDPLLCEVCSGRAHPVFLCDRVHCLCRDCAAPCEACGKSFCRACQPRCRCGR